MDPSQLPFDDFPKELLQHIVTYMEDEVLRNMRLASTKWFKLVDYRQFKVTHPTEETLPQVVDRLLQYHGSIGLKIKKSRMKLGEYSAQLSRLTNLTSLNLAIPYDPNLSPREWYDFTALTNLREWHVPSGCPAEVLASLTNMTELRLQRYDAHVVIEGLKRMSYLEHVDCTYNACYDHPLDIYSLLPCPTRLTSLVVTAKMDHANTSKLFNLRHIRYDDAGQGVPLKLSFGAFTALQSLDLLLGESSFDNAILPTTLTLLSIYNEHMREGHYEQLARLHNLKSLCIQAPPANDEHYTWISHLTALQSLNLWLSFATNEPVVFTGTMLGLIKSSQLTELVIEATPSMTLDHLSHLTTLEDILIYENDQVPTDLDYSPMSHLTRLTSIYLYKAYHSPSLSAITSLESLKRLNINNTALPMTLPPISFARLTSLESLNIEECEVVSVQSLSALSHLTFLDIGSLPNINYEFLKALPLECLNVTSEGANGDNFYSVLVQLTSLQSLAIRGLSASQVIGLSSLQGLETLRLFKCNGQRGQNLTHLTFLRELTLSGACNVSRYEGKLIEQSMPNLFAFTMHDN